MAMKKYYRVTEIDRTESQDTSVLFEISTGRVLLYVEEPSPSPDSKLKSMLTLDDRRMINSGKLKIKRGMLSGQRLLEIKSKNVKIGIDGKLKYIKRPSHLETDPRT